MPAETHVERSPIGPDEVLRMIRERLAEILEIDEGTITLDCEVRRRSRRRLARAHRAGRGARGGARRAHRRVQHRRRRPRAISTRCATPSTTSCTASAPPARRHADGDEEVRMNATGRSRSERRPRRPAASSRSVGRSTTTRCSTARSRTARTARSTASSESNERLEFLGDSVLGFVVTTSSTTSTRQLPEGELAKLRATVVSAETLAELAAARSTSARRCAWARVRTRRAAAASRRSSPTRWKP